MPKSTVTQDQVVQIRANASLMTFEAGVYCIFLAPDQGFKTQAGFPSVVVSRAPNIVKERVVIRSLDEDGSISADGGAAIVHVKEGPAQVLVTTYHAPGLDTASPNVQVARLSGPVAAPPTPRGILSTSNTGVAPSQPQVPAPPQPRAASEIAAHIQRRGDVLGNIGEWMGEPGSMNWIEGFGLSPQAAISAQDIEYQAVLGRGWLSPWADGGQYCGSRGMALPILGLRVRLKGKAAENYQIKLMASFVDGTRVGPVGSEETAESDSLAPLEAFLLEIVERKGASSAKSGAKKTAKPSNAVHRDTRKAAKRPVGSATKKR